MESTARRIKMAMDLRGVRQADLVEKTKISKGALSSYIAGRYVPKQNNIYLIAKALDVSESWLMGLDVPMERDESVSIGSRIREFRERLGLTQEELASMLGYKSKSSINKIETGINDITQSKVVAFAKALETTPAALMGWEDDIGKNPLTKNDEREIGRDLDRIMDEIENDVDGPLFYNGEPIDDESLKLLRNALELGLRELKRENKVKYGQKKKND